MTDQLDLLLDSSFSFKTFTIENLMFGDYYHKIIIENINDIYVSGETSKMNITEKFRLFQMEPGFIHMPGLTIEINEQKIKSFRLRGKYLGTFDLKTVTDIESLLGKPDKVLTEGIMWVTDFVAEAMVLVYRALGLHFHCDIESKKIIEIRLGKLDEGNYL